MYIVISEYADDYIEGDAAQEEANAAQKTLDAAQAKVSPRW
jgi:ribosomal protein L7/L12